MTLVRTSPSGPDIDVGGGGVESVFGRDGDVVGELGDYDSGLIQNASGVAGATVTAALDALATSVTSLTSSQIANSSSVSGSSVTAALNALLALTGKVLAYTEYLSGSGTHVFNPNSTLRIIHLQAGGGGGAGVTGAGGACRVGVGGQAGRWVEITETGAPTGTGIYSVGAAGTGGIGGGADGTPGGDTSLGVNGGTQTAAGGIRGTNRTSGGTLAGIETPAPSSGVANSGGEYGSVAFNLSSSLGISGSGGSSMYGRGGAPFFATGTIPGQDGLGRGSGGSGGLVVNSGALTNGGNGVAGLIRIWEFG